MFSVLANRTYRHLLMAQIIALIGTGLATVALGLLAWDIAGDQASLVLGIALTIKMIAYVTLAPIAAAFATQVPRRTMLVVLDFIRASVAFCLPFVTEIWQIYVLIFLLQAASAGFTPTFQATIPDVLPDEEDYTKALSLSRMAYDMESLLSPMLAAALLTIVSFEVLFSGTVIGFAASALLVLSATLPAPRPTPHRPVWERTTRGLRIYLATPRLRGLLGLNLTVAAASAMVIVNTVLIVKGQMALSERHVALALAAFGGGSMTAALLLPKLLHILPDRAVMFTGAGLLGLGLIVGPLAITLMHLALLWLVIGFGFSLVQTPSGRLLRTSARAEDRPAVFAAQFSLSHACWLLTYPLAGWLATQMGLTTTFLVLAALCILGIFVAWRFWPSNEPVLLPHTHPELSPDHPHLQRHGSGEHRHAIIIDDLHQHWPSRY
ncbi:Major Facilitator Superfamily protein [Roseovarius albus]|uniref:Major Facilitator Superfamily protein n=1 Tax=Roseovarius albus TaxID=1247867 RepID=A0A1X6YQZ2_9RHOB|nr:MFS transporter [Roseovarius albus]SLN28300.1 Major Facilitator Superfamily protein [Roseovarius albus]